MSMWGMHPSINMRCLITTRPFSANGRHSRGSELESWRESMDGSQQCPVGWQLSKSRFVGGVTKRKSSKRSRRPFLVIMIRQRIRETSLGGYWNIFSLGETTDALVINSDQRWKNLRALHALGETTLWTPVTSQCLPAPENVSAIWRDLPKIAVSKKRFWQRSSKFQPKWRSGLPVLPIAMTLPIIVGGWETIQDVYPVSMAK